MNEAVKKPFYKKWWFWVLVVIVLGAIGQSGKHGKTPDSTTSDSSQSSSGTTAPAASTAAPAVQLPADEQKFISIVADAQTKARSAENDMQKGGVKAERDKALCAAMSAGSVTDWVGKLVDIDANSDGKGVLAIELARDIQVKTWNNAFSDSGDNTLLEPGTPIFNTVSQMKKGSMVKFSGSFFPGLEGDCLKESSLSLNGKIRSPEFIFRFESVTAN